MPKILDGKKLAQKIKKHLFEEQHKEPKNIGLAAILVGSNPASQTYIKLKQKACQELNVYFEKYHFEKIKQIDLINLIKKLNKRKKITGILVQMPLPRYLNANKIILAIEPKKDVDGFHPENIEKLLQNQKAVVSPLAQAVLELLKSTKVNLNCKKILIISNSKNFPEVLISLLKRKGLKAEYVLFKDKKIKQKIKQSDVLIVGVGKPKFIKAQMIKKGVIIIDIGYNRAKGKSVGDVDLENVLAKVKFISPVPGGVGPLTVAFLMKNLLETQ